MLCDKCGAQIPDDSAFCDACGKSVNINLMQQYDAQLTGTDEVDNKRLFKIALCILGAALVLSLIIAFSIPNNDLNGHYSCRGAWLLTDFDFKTDGTFTCECNYYEWDSGAVYYGKYRKSGKRYYISIKGANTVGGNAVTNFMDSRFGEDYKFEAEKIDDQTLAVYVYPESWSSAWLGKSAYFYKTY
jgi:hypothetical protein